MSTVIAGDLDQLGGLQRTFHRYSQDVEDLMRALTQELNGTYWKGRRAENFVHAWETEYRPTLTRLATALVEAGDECGNSANDLHTVGG
jgi:hypothetical protein